MRLSRPVMLVSLFLTLGCDRGEPPAPVDEAPATSALAPPAAPPLMAAAIRGDLLEVRNLLKAGTPVDQRGAGQRTALMAAAEAGHLAVVEALLEAGASSTVADTKSNTALILASRRGHDEVAARLIAAGANVNMANRDGITALFESIRAGNFALFERLLAAGADLRQVTRSGEQPLHFAAASSPDIVEHLLAGGADVDVRNSAGVTPAMLAARAGELEALRRLVSAGADLRLVDAHGNSALDHARQKKRRDVIAFLEAELSTERSTPETSGSYPS